MSKPDPFAAQGSDGRLSVPFLPTLVMALVLGAASLLCREPAAVASADPVPVPAASVAPASVAPPAFHADVPAEAAPSRAPAAIAFAQFPPSFVLPEVRIADAPRPPARVANAATLRRACTAPRCAEGPPRRPDPFAEVVRPTPVEAEAETRDGLLPDLALPFAPAARVVGEAAAFVRTGTASLGGSVSVLFDRLR